jgi:hypothetical protein
MTAVPLGGITYETPPAGAAKTPAGGTFNEWGYICRLADLTAIVGVSSSLAVMDRNRSEVPAR